MPAGYIFNILCIIILALGLFLWYRRGLFKSIMKLVAVVIALLLAGQLAQAGASFAIEKMKPAVEKATAEEVERLLQQTEVQLGDSAGDYLEQLIEKVPFSFLRESLQDWIQQGEWPQLSQQTRQEIQKQLTDCAQNVAFQVLDTSVRALLFALFYLIGFLLLLVLLNWILKLLNLTFQLPVLHGVNACGGALFGILEAGLWLLLGTHILAYFAAGWLQQELSTSALAQFFLHFDPMKLF